MAEHTFPFPGHCILVDLGEDRLAQYRKAQRAHVLYFFSPPQIVSHTHELDIVLSENLST